MTLVGDKLVGGWGECWTPWRLGCSKHLSCSDPATLRPPRARQDPAAGQAAGDRQGGRRGLRPFRGGARAVGGAPDFHALLLGDQQPPHLLVVMARRTDRPWTPRPIKESHRRREHGRCGRTTGFGAGSQDPSLQLARPRRGRRGGGGDLPSQADRAHHGSEIGRAGSRGSPVGRHRGWGGELERSEADLSCADQTERPGEAHQRDRDRGSGLIG